MAADEIRTLGDDELAEELEETQKALMNLRFRAATICKENSSSSSI